jgi:mannose-6-phosphate isomerase-like protein (cupin superfamily)
MIENEHTVGYCELDESEQFYPVGEPGDYFDYLYLRGGYVHDVNALPSSLILYKDDNICIEYCATGKTNNTLLVNAEIITDEENATMTNCFQITMDGYVRQNKTWQLTDFVRGWFIGNFEPNIVKTDKYEVALLTHCKGEKWDFHYHRLADEINFLVEGRMLINERLVEKGSLFVIQKNQLTCPNFLENCKVLCIKVPSVPSDKYGV